VKVGEFARGGKSRVPVQALDHDFQPDRVLTPAGILLPEHGELFLSIVESKATSDCIVDDLQHVWDTIKPRFEGVKTLLLNQDNGPESSSRRTQYINRLVAFADTNQVNLRLAYYPPYHSKYNPIERCWGALEQYWNGAQLDSTAAVVGMAAAMRWKGSHPIVRVVKTVYEKGVKVAKNAMKKLEERLTRLPGLEKWFVDIRCAASVG
jgi:hypothetical protein